MRRCSSSKDTNLLIKTLCSLRVGHISRGDLMAGFARPREEGLSACLALQAITAR